MIAHLRGTLLAKRPNQAIVETHGVGYDVAISVPTFTEMPAAGADVALHIHTHVREDALSLYGFLRLAEKQLFEKLLTVSGIGPKLAITILSGMPVTRWWEQFAAATWRGSRAFQESARRRRSAWCWNCATNCRRRRERPALR